MSQSGILNRGVYPPGTVVEKIQGSNNGNLENPARTPDASNKIILNSTNGNLTFANDPVNAHILNMTVSTSPITNYVNVTGAAVATEYTATTSNEFISCDTSAGGAVIKLPSAGVSQGEFWTIKDRTGQSNFVNPPDAFTGAITIQPVDGSKTIDGAANVVINIAHKSVRILYNGTNYEVF